MMSTTGRKIRGTLLSRVALVAALMGTSVFVAAVAPAPNHPAKISTVEPVTTGSTPGFRRLNEGEYLRSVDQVFGPGIKVPGRFDPPLRDEGLMAIGDGKAVISSSGIEQYELRAREIAAQVLAPAHRAKALTCTPQSATASDEVCATKFLSEYGRLLYRRPLSPTELASVLDVASNATQQSHDFYKGLEIGLSRELASPWFIFRVERGEPDPHHAGVERLDSYSLATRISFLLWDAPPDAQLLDAAAAGDLNDQAKLKIQIDRLMASPRFEQGMRSFFSDMFGYERFDGLTKDQAIFPKFNSALAKDAQEQSLRTVIDLLITHNGDYRELFTTKKTFINRNMGALYKVAVDGNAMGDNWVPYTFAANDPRAGILTLPAFLMLDPTHEGRTSPTIRGKNVRELFLCQSIPQPPPNVNFAAVENTGDVVHRTARERLTVHRSDPSCAGCHQLTDPIGLSMENYDSIGVFRQYENGALIDASGMFDGKNYTNVIGLEKVLHDDPGVPACAVQRAFEYGAGRTMTSSEQKWADYAGQQFAADKYQFPALVRRIAMSAAFRSVAPDTAPAPVKAAAR